jgi:hypothetical protein
VVKKTNLNKNQMESTIFKRNTNYSRKILIIILLSFILYQLFNFLKYPSEHTYFLFRTKEIVVLFSLFGIVFCFLGVFVVFKSVIGSKAYLKIDANGIFNGFFLYKKKFIGWEEINEIRTIKYNYNNYIAIFLKKSRFKEKGLSYIFYKINEYTIGTPYVIYSGDLECNFQELEMAIKEAFLIYKKRKKVSR